MALMPDDLLSKRFTPVRFSEGYDMDEVDNYLDNDILPRLQELIDENNRLTKELEEAHHRIAELDSAPAPHGSSRNPCGTSIAGSPSPCRAAATARSTPPPVSPRPGSCPGSRREGAERRRAAAGAQEECSTAFAISRSRRRTSMCLPTLILM